MPTRRARGPKCRRIARSAGVAIVKSPSQLGKKIAIFIAIQDTRPADRHQERFANVGPLSSRRVHAARGAKPQAALRWVLPPQLPGAQAFQPRLERLESAPELDLDADGPQRRVAEAVGGQFHQVFAGAQKQGRAKPLGPIR